MKEARNQKYPENWMSRGIEGCSHAKSLTFAEISTDKKRNFIDIEHFQFVVFSATFSVDHMTSYVNTLLQCTNEADNDISAIV